MESVITRILEIEKQSAMDIERTEDTCRKNIAVHRQALEEEKERGQFSIIANENKRLAQALQALNKQAEETILAADVKINQHFRAPSLNKTIKERIVAILLAG